MLKPGVQGSSQAFPACRADTLNFPADMLSQGSTLTLARWPEASKNH